MSLLLASVAVALALVMVLSLYRVVSGPSIFDRLTGLGLIGSKTIVLLIVLGAWNGRVELYVDIALSYGLISFVGTLVLAKYFEVTTGPRATQGRTPVSLQDATREHVGSRGSE
ncbi:MAG: monovalent cation/H+ antiporter complex subunit F [Vicinamibacterales bacterium]